MDGNVILLLPVLIPIVMGSLVLTVKGFRKNRNVLKMQAEDGGGVKIDALYFGGIEKFKTCLEEKYGHGFAERFLDGKEPEARMMIAYYPGINEYMGRKSLQIVITHCQ